MSVDTAMPTAEDQAIVSPFRQVRPAEFSAAPRTPPGVSGVLIADRAAGGPARMRRSPDAGKPDLNVRERVFSGLCGL